MKNLKGTEKQVKWAETIKTDMVQCMKNKIKATHIKFDNVKMDSKSEENFKIGLEFLEEKLQEVKAEQSAEWFINNRNYVYGVNALIADIGSVQYKEINLTDIYNLDPTTTIAKFIRVINANTTKEYVQLF